MFSLNRSQQQMTNVVMITFWSQFSSYAMNSILILFLTRPYFMHGLQYDEATAYTFMGVSTASSYLMLILGGHMADEFIGLRRSILIGSLLLAAAYLLITLSGYTLELYHDFYFLAAYALIPAANSILAGSATGLVSQITPHDPHQTKIGMTYYYLAINCGALLATFIAPELLNSRYGPLSVLALTFAGKSLAALNFAWRYRLYDNIIVNRDKSPLSRQTIFKLCGYFLVVYAFTLFAYTHLTLSNILISLGCIAGIIWFFIKTLSLSPEARFKQLTASFLILEAIVFFVIYNQMNSTLVLVAQNNSNSQILGMAISPAQFQMLNPLLILFLGLQLPRFYRTFPRFSIPYQFATGTLLASLGLLNLVLGAHFANDGLLNGNFIAVTYILISLAELWVSAIGLSMISLYCDHRNLAFAMGTWFLACSLSNTISASIAHWAAIPKSITEAGPRLGIYSDYYLILGGISAMLALLMFFAAAYLRQAFYRRGMVDG